MRRVRVTTLVDAPPPAVWEKLRDIASHVSWMEDAVAIRFTSPSREGAGTTFDCDTKVGPFRVTDRLEVTEWSEGEAIGIRHVGVVSGSGRFAVTGTGDGRTELTWDERLGFPWWMGGPAGAAVAALVLRPLWRRNLARFKREVETGAR